VLAAGFVLRHLQTGRVQVYAAAMVLGLAGVGWFLTAPQLAVAVTGSDDAGQYHLNASPGFGYGYRWDSDGDGTFESADYGGQRDLDVTVGPGEEKSVVLEVQNAFGRIGQRRFTFSRRDPAAKPVEAEPQKTGLASPPTDGRLARGERAEAEARASEASEGPGGTQGPLGKKEVAR
jgi:NADH-quinone oxidoreductase subunit L